MPKVKTLQSNFSAGELSPLGAGRVDIARYPNAAKVMKNVISRTLGGAKKRAGMEWLAAAKHDDKTARLVPYIINRDTAYMLEMGDTYLRVFKTDGTQVETSPGVPYEITTPYTEAYLPQMDYAKDEDAMFLFHSAVFPNRLRRFADASWDCSAAPFTTTPFSEQGHYPAATLTLSANTVGTGRTMTASAAVFMASDVGRAILWNAGIFVITAYTDTTHVTGEVKIVFDSATIPSGSWNMDSSPQTSLTPGAKDPVGASTSLTLAAAGWRSGDVGKYVRLNGGLIKITAVGTTTGATGTIINELTSTTAAPGLAWTLESTVWGSTFGYPQSGTLHEQRLVAAGTTKYPQTVWGSKTGEVLDFTIGTADDDAFSFTVSDSNNQTNQISFIVSARNLLVLTHGGEFSMQGGVEKPITPTNIQIRPQSPHGAKKVRPVQVGKETLFAQRAGRKLRALRYRYDEDGYQAPDLTTLAEHITETGIACMAFQQEPDPILWIVLGNGRLISVTIDRELDVLAWNRHETEGAVEWVATVPSGDTEQVWVLVRRSVNGSIVRYVERLQESWYPIYGTDSPDYDAFPVADEPTNWGFQLDCAISQDDAVGKAVWNGLGHLEGETVRCIADGVDMGEFTVTAGAITLTRAAKRVLVGLMYAPTIEMLPPEIQSGEGTSQASAMSTNSFVVRVNNTLSVTVNGEEIIPGRITGPAQFDTPPALFTGDKSVSVVGWDQGKSPITISQNAPFPFHLLATIRTVTVNGG